ncbi:MAG TPA: hypothetical protein DCL61_23860, partial [Cyanobacteria bacterium UBA12227]|nr:hypothetical protein [Cyanobacteria bacterium UBA12227]
MTLEEAIAPDLPLETFEEVYRRLLRALRRKKGFGLFFVLQSDYAQGNQIIEGIRQDLPQKKIAVLQIDRKTKTLYDKIAELKEQEPFDILFIRGIENALYEYQDTKRISGWTEQEIYAYSWKGVPPILSHLNQQRERFSQDFPCSLVFFAPSFAINYFIQRAPDFFDWRSGLFHFPLTEEEVYIRENNLVAERVKECLKLTLQELVDTKLQIDDLMAQRHNSPETTAKLLFDQGLLFWSGKQYNKAFSLWNKVLELNPNDYAAWHNQGFILFFLGRYQEALASFKKAIEINPNNPRIWDIRGSLLMLIGRQEEALTNWKKLIDLVPVPDELNVAEHKARSLAKLGRYNKTATLVESSIIFNSGYPSIWYHRGIVLLTLNRYQEALSSFDRSVNLDSNNYRAWNDRGVALLILERYEEALSSFDQAIKLNSAEYLLLYNRGIALLALERYEEALLIFNQIIDFNYEPESLCLVSSVTISLAASLTIRNSNFNNNFKSKLTNNEYEQIYFWGSITLSSYFKFGSKVVNKWEKVVALLKSNAWVCHGISLLNIERHEEALNSIEQAISINTNNFYAWIAKGEVLAKLGKNIEAIASYKEAIRNAPNLEFNYIKMSSFCYKEKLFYLAIDCLRRGIRKNPHQHSILWNNLGFIYLILNRIEKANSCLNRAIQTTANNFIPIFNLGLVHVLKGNDKEAKRLIQKSLKCCDRENTKEKLYFALGTIVLGQQQEGLENLQETLSTLT